MRGSKFFQALDVNWDQLPREFDLGRSARTKYQVTYLVGRAQHFAQNSDEIRWRRLRWSTWCSWLLATHFLGNFFQDWSVKILYARNRVKNLSLRTNSTAIAYIKANVRQGQGRELDRVRSLKEKGAGNMATYRDPVSCFAPLEVIERLLEIRVEAGFSPAVYLLSPDDLADYLDAYGFDVYALSEAEAEFHFGDYRAPLAPGGDHAHCSLTAH
jgi:hypothetical protein